jgi:DNA-binding MarR family transcriptional regulator
MKQFTGLDVTKMYPAGAPPDQQLADNWTWAFFLDAAEKCFKGGYPFGMPMSTTPDALLAQIMQSVACNALHTAEARCSRWLLSTQDRVRSTTLPLTQQALAEMLGVQRTTITAVMTDLQAAKLIRYERGRIEILSRTGIEDVACECYSAVESHADRLLRQR